MKFITDIVYSTKIYKMSSNTVITRYVRAYGSTTVVYVVLLYIYLPVYTVCWYIPVY